jgi:hypothetical protein
MEAWRQWLLGEEKKPCPMKKQRTHLTPTGLLMEGDYTQNPAAQGILSAMAIFRQSGHSRSMILKHEDLDCCCGGARGYRSLRDLPRERDYAAALDPGGPQTAG